MSINGARIAVEGDEIDCPACATKGRIACIGPRISDTWNGKQVALENDLCLCACSSPPRLVPNQTLKYQTVSETSSAWVSPPQPGAGAPRGGL